MSGNTSPLRSEERADYATTEAGYDADWSGPASAPTESEPFCNVSQNGSYRLVMVTPKAFRDATVLYYIENLSCSEVADKLQISTEMVKYYLFRARKIIREGMNMERLYGEKSYRPNIFEIDFWGTKAGDDREYRDFQMSFKVYSSYTNTTGGQQ